MTPRLSIVLAVQGGSQRLDPVLEALGSQLQEGVEVLVCFPAGERGVAEACERTPWVKGIEGTRGSLVPHLWRDGIHRSAARRVALSVVHCRPGPQWVENLLAADLDRFGAVGGSIDQDPDSDARGWAVYMLRYLRYGRPFSPHETPDLPGDNVVYDGAAILAHADAFYDGFWEPQIHARLIAEGRRLLLDPGLGVIHANGYGTLEFARQRFAHGRRFGRDRAVAMPGLRRLLYAMSSPLVPLVFGMKILRQALRRPDAKRNFPRAFPYLVIFILAWAAGEMRGVVDGMLGPGTSSPSE